MTLMEASTENPLETLLPSGKPLQVSRGKPYYPHMSQVSPTRNPQKPPILNPITLREAPTGNPRETLLPSGVSLQVFGRKPYDPQETPTIIMGVPETKARIQSALIIHQRRC